MDNLIKTAEGISSNTTVDIIVGCHRDAPIGSNLEAGLDMARSDFNFCWPFRIRYSEVDAQKVVFSAHYLTYFDTAITEYFRALPYDYLGQVDRTGEDFHTVKNLVEYQQAITFDEDIEVHVKIARMGRSSLTFALEIHPQGVEDLRATGEVIWVNTDQETHKSAALPQELVDKINHFEGLKSE